MRASMTWRGTLPLRNPGTRTSRDSRLAVRSIAGRSSSGSTTTLIRTLVGSTGSRVLRTGASGLGMGEPSGKPGKLAPRRLAPVSGRHSARSADNAGQYTGRACAGSRMPRGRWALRRGVVDIPEHGLWISRSTPIHGGLRSPTGDPPAAGPGEARTPVDRWNLSGWGRVGRAARDRATAGLGRRPGVVAGRGGGAARGAGGRGGHPAEWVLAGAGGPGAAGRRAAGVRQGGRARAQPRQPRDPPVRGPDHGRAPPLGPGPADALVARPERLGRPGLRGRGRRPPDPALAAPRAGPGPGDGRRPDRRAHPGPTRPAHGRRAPPGQLRGLAPAGRRPRRRRRRPGWAGPVGGPPPAAAGRPGGRL